MENNNQFRQFSGSSWNFQNCLPGGKMNFRSFQSFQKNKWPPCKTCDEFDFHVEVRQGSMIILLLFITVYKTLSYDFFTWCLWVLLYENNHAIISEKKDELQQKLRTWKRFWVNRSKTKIMISRPNLKNYGKYPCNIGRWIITNSVTHAANGCTGNGLAC